VLRVALYAHYAIYEQTADLSLYLELEHMKHVPANSRNTEDDYRIYYLPLFLSQTAMLPDCELFLIRPQKPTQDYLYPVGGTQSRICSISDAFSPARVCSLCQHIQNVD